jgi:hypothetical protein
LYSCEELAIEVSPSIVEAPRIDILLS